MHKEILTKEQINLLPLVSKFSRSFGLVGGTAIALHIGHRESIDFDLFSLKPFNNTRLVRKICETQKMDQTFVNKLGELTFLVNGVKVTFFHYPFNIPFTNRLDDIIRTPSLLTLASMKAYALGMRAKWKDYVDLYFILKDFHPMQEIVQEAERIFESAFNEKIFRTQLSYFKDIDYSEEVVFTPGFDVDEETIKKALTEWSVK